MNLKTRLIKLEENYNAPTPAPQMTEAENKIWFDSIQTKLDAIREANKGKPIEPWVITPIPKDASPSMAFLHAINNRMAGG